MCRSLVYLLTLVAFSPLLSCQNSSQTGTPPPKVNDDNTGLNTPSPSFEAETDWVSFYSKRYDLESVDAQLTDNRGDGYDKLYGTRNMRKVFDGILYRGGANNYYHKKNKKDNRNPLPQDGIDNLCSEGFGTSVYLYTTNYDKAPKLTRCDSIRKTDNEMKYLNLQPRKSDEMKEILKLVFENIQDYRHGPIYAHCWNGWHASGQVASYALKQFCGWNGKEALDYWLRNAIGGEKDNYAGIRRRIKEFEPYEEFLITEAQAERICP